jgi:hypothetical protein
MKRLIAAVVFLLIPTLAKATITNGGFETGDFSGWLTIGDVAVVDVSLGTVPAAGSYQALINSGRDSFSGIFEVDVGTLSSFLGIPANGLENIALALGDFHHVMVGSAIQQLFIGNPGDVLSFRWNYLTNDQVFAASSCCDFSFVVLDGTISSLGYFGSALSPSSTSFFQFETGYQLFATTLTSGGTHTLAFGAVQTFDDIADSGMAVDSVLLREISEPGSFLMFAIGLMCLMVGFKFGLKT